MSNIIGYRIWGEACGGGRVYLANKEGACTTHPKEAMLFFTRYEAERALHKPYSNDGKWGVTNRILRVVRRTKEVVGYCVRWRRHDGRLKPEWYYDRRGRISGTRVMLTKKRAERVANECDGQLRSGYDGDIEGRVVLRVVRRSR